MRLRVFVSCFALGGVSFMAAQSNPRPKADKPEDPLPPIFAPRAPPKDAKSAGSSRPVPAVAPTRRAISPEMAANISAVALRAAPPANATPPAGVAASAPTGESSDAVQLRPYIVKEDRLPEFKEREMLTPKGKLELARRRYPGVVGLFSDAVLLQLLEEDFARERRQEAADLRGLLDIGGTKLPPEVKRQIGDGALRPSGFSPEIGAPFRTPR